MAYRKIRARINPKHAFQAIIQVPGEQWEHLESIETYASSFIGGQPAFSETVYKKDGTGDLDLYIRFPSTVEADEFIHVVNTNLYGIPR